VRRVAGVCVGLSDLAQHCQRAQSCRDDPAAHVADNGGFTVVEPEHVAWVNAWIDASDNHHVSARVDGQP